MPELRKVTERSEELIERARKKMAEKEGERVKVRLPNAMWKGIGKCAQACGLSCEEWVCRSLMAWSNGKYDGVEYDEKSILGTRKNSKTGWVRVPNGFGKDCVRRALAAGLAWCKKRIPAATPQKGTEVWVQGRDYLVESER